MEAENGRILNFENPATGDQFGSVSMSSPEEIQQALTEMRSAARVWSGKPVKERIRILKNFVTIVLDSIDEISDVITQDTGKSRQDGVIEIFVTLDMISHQMRGASKWLRPYEVPRGVLVFKKHIVEHRPYGVAAVISPWNYPFNLAVAPVLSALLAGNTVVLKPSEVTAATGVLLEQLFKRAEDLAPFIRVIHGDGNVGAALVRAVPDFIFVTGSVPTGRKVLEAAAENLIPVACELGGKDAMIVLEDADLRAAARWGTWGAFYNSGQTCMSVERVYVIDSVYDEFLRLVIEEAEKIKVGFTREPDNPFSIGPITDPRQMKVILRHLEDAKDKGAEIVFGGNIDGMFCQPTVLVNANHTMLVMREETFGPIMPIMKVRDEYEAIQLANDCSLGLGASIWSQNLARAERVSRQIEASSVIINDTIAQFAAPMLPFGGIKQSGAGRVHGKEGLLQFTQPYSYMVGEPPPEMDIAKILRQPGKYHFGKALTLALFGTNAKQKLRPVIDESARKVRQAAPQDIAKGVALGMAVLMGMRLFSRLSHGRRHNNRRMTEKTSM